MDFLLLVSDKTFKGQNTLSIAAASTVPLLGGRAEQSEAEGVCESQCATFFHPLRASRSSPSKRDSAAG